MVPNFKTNEYCDTVEDIEEKTKQAYWVCLTYLACHGVRKTSDLNSVFVNLEKHRENAYWLRHYLMAILDLIVTDGQD